MKKIIVSVALIFSGFFCSLLAQNQVLTKVNGGASWENSPGGDELGPNVEWSLSGTELTISDGTNSDMQDLLPLRDGIGTDDQTIDEWSVDGVFLSLSVEGDNQTTHVLNMSPIIRIERFAVTVDFPSIAAGGSATIDVPRSSTFARLTDADHVIFGMPTTIATENVSFTAQKLYFPDLLRVRCFNHGSSAINLPSFELKGAVSIIH